MGRTRVRWDRVAGVALALAAALGLAGRALGGSEGAPPPPRGRYMVREGDTLWAIARTRVGTRADPRPMIQDIREANGLLTPALTPGQTLVLP